MERCSFSRLVGYMWSFHATYHVQINMLMISHKKKTKEKSLTNCTLIFSPQDTKTSGHPMTGLSKETPTAYKSIRGPSCTGVQPIVHQNCPIYTNLLYNFLFKSTVKSHWFFFWGPVFKKNHGLVVFIPNVPMSTAIHVSCQSCSFFASANPEVAIPGMEKKNLPGSEIHNQPIVVIWSNWTCVHTTSVKYYVNNIHNQSKHKTTNQSELVFLIFIHYICIVCSSLKLVSIIETLHWSCVWWSSLRWKLKIASHRFSCRAFSFCVIHDMWCISPNWWENLHFLICFTGKKENESRL